MATFPLVSIIIPFYGSSTVQLLKCIRALECQTYPLDKTETLIIDNNKNQVIDSGIGSLLKVKVLHEPAIGSYSARNMGIVKSEGNVLAFTDSDCIPHFDWLKNGVSALAESDSSIAVGGNIIMTFQNPSNPGMVEKYDTFFHLRQESYVINDKFAATANLIAPKILFQKYGNFNTNRFSGSDREWGEKISEQGCRIYFTKEAIVYHPARNSLDDIIQKNCRIVGGEYSGLIAEQRKKIQILKVEILKFKVKLGMLKNSITQNNKLEIIKLTTILSVVHLIRFIEALRLLSGGKVRRR